MSVLHPVGPEAPETYWVRRVIVIVTAIIVLAGLIAALVNATSGSTATPAPVAPPTVAAGSPTPTVMSTELRTPGVSTPSASSTMSSRPSPSAKGPSQTPTDSVTSAAPSSSKPTSPSSPPTKSSPAACPADDLRVTLNGKHRLKVKQSNTFDLSVINGAGQTCVAEITPENFELKIYSGTDRIWSTDHCASKVKTISKTLAAERSTSWKITWNGRRSKAGCKQRSEIPRPGTYFATAQLKDAKPVQLRMILGG